MKSRRVLKSAANSNIFNTYQLQVKGEAVYYISAREEPLTGGHSHQMEAGSEAQIHTFQINHFFVA